MSLESAQFEQLRQFLGGWFHQDFDIDGDDIGEIVADYARVSAPEDVDALKSEIDAFVTAHPDDLDEAFVRVFRPDIDPAGWGLSTREWLDTVRMRL